MTDRERLVAKYAQPLALHNEYRMTAAHVTRLPSLNTALGVVQARLSMLDERRIAA